MRKLMQNLLSIVVTDIGRRIMGFFAVALLARNVGVEGFGMVNIAFSVLSYGLMLAGAGVTTYGVRDIARGGNEQTVARVLGARLLLSLGVLSLVSMVSFLFIRDNSAAILIVIFVLSLLPNSYSLEWYFLGREEMGIAGISRLLSAALYLLGILVWVHSPGDLFMVGVAVIISDSAAAIFLLWKFRSRFGIRQLIPDLSRLGELLRPSWTLGAGSLLSHLSVNFPPIALGLVAGAAAVGIYSAASKLIFFLLMLDRALAALLLPSAARSLRISRDALTERLTKALRWISLSAVPLTAGGLFVADSLISLVFGREYRDATLVFAILIWYFLLTTFHTVATSGLIALGKEKGYMKIMAISALVYGSLTVVGVYFAGAAGAAFAMSAAESITLLLMFRELHKEVSLPLFQNLRSTVPAALVMVFLLWLLPPWHVLILTVIGASAYAAILFLTKSITIAEVKSLFVAP